MVGDELPDNEAVMHAGGPAAKLAGLTASHELPFHHMRLDPPFRLQSWMTSVVKALPAATCTSKYSPDGVNVGVPAGFEPYWARVKEPTPVAVTVVPALVA